MKDLGKSSDRLPRKRTKKNKKSQARKKIVVVDKNIVAKSRFHRWITKLHLEDHIGMQMYVSGLMVINNNRIDLDTQWFIGKCCLELNVRLQKEHYNFTSVNSTDYSFRNKKTT